MKFSDLYIKNLKPDAKKYYRREANGFTVRVMPSGAKTWLFIYTFEGKRKEMNLGSYPEVKLADARAKYSAAYELLRNGKDPAGIHRQEEEARRKAPTVSDLCAEYIERHAKPKKRSWAKDDEILRRDVIPIWGKRKAADITRREVIHLLEGIVDRGAPAMANYCFAILRKMFNFAVERDVMPASPCTRIKLPAPRNIRERTLNEAEIKSFWENLEHCAMSDETRRALKLILVTAQRPGEVIGMHVKEIDGRWWTIPAERAKNGRTHRVYLTDLALALIGDAHSKGFVFPTPSAKKDQAMAPQALVVALSRNMAWPLTDERGRLLYEEDGKATTEKRLKLQHFTPHDLRRTAATFMAEMREMDEVIDAILNHAKKGIIRVYNQYRYDREKQAALESWERRLLSIIAGTSSAAGSFQCRGINPNYSWGENGT